MTQRRGIPREKRASDLNRLRGSPRNGAEPGAKTIELLQTCTPWNLQHLRMAGARLPKMCAGLHRGAE